MSDRLRFNLLPPPALPRYSNLERARGFLDFFWYRDGQLILRGWTVHPTQPLDAAKFYINGELIAARPLILRRDLRKTFKPVAHAERGGFKFLIPWNRAPLGEVACLTVIGCNEGEEKTIFESYSEVQRPIFTAPPVDLMARVAGTGRRFQFRYIGLNAVLDIVQNLKRFRDLNSIRSLLDWGCGCGRLASLMVKVLPDAALSGCDIDPNGANWCAANIAEGRFTTIDPYPPAPYPDASFDAIYATSVMTHLTRKNQQRWLGEMRRILKPNGIFLCSTHGEFAASFAPGGLEYLIENHITDEVIDHALDGIAPEGYYRGTFQTEQYTRENWSQHFRILDYIPAGLGAFQDLVILEPR